VLERELASQGGRSLTCQRELRGRQFVSKNQTNEIAIPLASVPVTSEVIDQAIEDFYAAYSGTEQSGDAIPSNSLASASA